MCHPRPFVCRPAPAGILRTALSAALCAAIFVTLDLSAASAEGINFSWDECGSAGSQLKTFACNTNTATFQAVGSFVPPANVNELLGMTAEIRVGSSALPDWWKHGTGQCRGTAALSADFDFTSGGACTDFWAGGAAGGISYSIGGFGPNTARIQVLCAVPIDSRGPVSPAQEYYAFRLRLLSGKTTGAGICVGCETPVSLTLENIQLFQPPESANDPILTAPLTRGTISWQGATPDAPTISSLSPNAGAPGGSVTIHGTTLAPTTAVRFGALDAAFSVVSDVEVTATIPTGAASGPITLETPFGRATSERFTLRPTVVQFLPKQAPSGTTIYLKGRDFTGTTLVRFNGIAATFSVATDSSITTVVPGAATTGPISVTNPGGTAATDSLFRVGPVQGALDLSWDDCGLAGAEMKTFACDTNFGPSFTLIGSFAPPPGVDHAIGAIADLGVSGGALPDWWRHGVGECRLGAGLNISQNFATGPSTCSKTWVSRISTGSFTYAIGFYGAGTARLRLVYTATETQLDPNAEQYAFKVNITRNKTISDGSCAGCEVPVSVTFHQIQLLQIAAVGYDPVITLPFHRNRVFWQGEPGPPPRIELFTPTAGAAGTMVTIEGEFFSSASDVLFRNEPASFTVVSDQEITTQAPPGVRTGPISVTTPHGTATSDSLFFAHPTFRLFVPGTAPVGDTITVLGTNFTRAIAVKFNGLNAPFSVTTDSTLFAAVPSGATDGFVSVTTPAGTAVSERAFHVGPVPEGSLNLSWSDCGLSGVETQRFACDTNAGSPFTVVGSFVPPPDVLELIGLAAEIRVTSFENLPDWWKHGAGSCRGTSALTASFDFNGMTACDDILQNQATGSRTYAIGFHGPNSAQLLVSCSMPVSAGAVDPSREYYAFKALIQRTSTTGAPSCADCIIPVSLSLDRLQLFQRAELAYDPVLTTPKDRNVAYWQGEPGPRPRIDAFAPRSGAPGTMVTIDGEFFSGATAVRFHDAPAPFTVDSDQVITAEVPANARTGFIFVTSLNGTSASDSLFFEIPTIRVFVPGTAPVGDTISILGANFTQATAVKFNGLDATFSVSTDSTISAQVPSGTTDGFLSVTTPGGTAVSERAFHVGPVPEGSLNLSWYDCGLAGAETEGFACNTNTGGPFPLVGSFVPPPDVLELIGLTAEIRVMSTENLPDWWKHGAGSCRGPSALTASFDFRDMPTCDDIFLNLATGGSTYAIGFHGPNTARLLVSCSLPVSAGAADPSHEHYAFKALIQQTSSTGASSCAGCGVPVSLSLDRLQLFQSAELAYDPIITIPKDRHIAYWQAVPGPVPRISSFEPAAGAPGQLVTISGSEFTGALSVRFHTVEASSFTVVSDARIDATVPTGARTGPIRVQTTQGTGASDSAFIVAPNLLSFTPRSAPVGYPIQIRGLNFTRTLAVSFHGTPATFLVESDSTLEANVPAGADDGPITITNPGGSDTSDSTFRTGPLPPACVTIEDVAVIEGDAGKSLAVIRVNLSSPSGEVVTVSWSTADGSATVANNDYQVSAGTLTFPLASTVQEIAVPVNGDVFFEGDESFRVLLDFPTNATLCDGDDTGVVTIRDDEFSATMLSQFTAEASSEGVELTWRFGDPASIQNSWAERADGATARWAKIDAEVRSEHGLQKMVDRTVEPDHTYYYRVSAQLSDGQILVSEPIAATTLDLIEELALGRIVPNPTSGRATIDYVLPRLANVRLTVLDIHGRVVTTLVDGEVKAGRHQTVWNAASRGSAQPGMYFVRLEAEGRSVVKRLALMR